MYEIYSAYRNSRIVNHNRWSIAKEVNKLVDILVAGMQSELSIKKSSGYKYNMKTLIMELYHSHLTDKDQYIAYFRTKNKYDFKIGLIKGISENRYNKNPHISYTFFVGCVDYLASKGHIENNPGGQFRDDEGSAYGYLSRMKANESLISLWKEYNFNPDMITVFKPAETIILRGKEENVTYLFKDNEVTKKIKPLIDYLDKPRIVNMRKGIERYNRLLERTHIDVDVDCMSQSDKDTILDRLLHAKDKTKYTINLGAKQVYRVFNNGSFKEGGRFYGAWWIGCPSIVRKYITINGEPTAEIDYSGIHIHLLYALKGLNFPELKTDAYELIDNDPDRELNKLILLTALNVNTNQSTAKAVFKEARDNKTKHKYKLKKHKQVDDKLELLKQKHDQIKEYIAQGYGSILQYHDSKVIESLIEHYSKQDIPILTIHDSVICQAKYKDFVYDKMKRLYTDYINSALKCNTIYESIHPQARHSLQQYQKAYSAYSATLIPELNPVLAQQINHAGKMPVVEYPVIKIKAKTINANCSNVCHHAKRLAKIKAGNRIFLGKIKIEHKVLDNITSLSIIQ
ncbi:MAG: hypothetical protein HXX11_10100 [Desulfuromonadales bacterium]|nr:hypothetical protein [Desulfuromonadales bacterium]